MKPELVAVPAATFWMGCNHAAANQAPAHRVCVGAFSMMRFPVARRDYQRFLDAGRHPRPPCWDDFPDDDIPACGPSWDDAVAYAAWLSDETRQPLRLPTEAEREWAASGGVLDTVYPWGNLPPVTAPLDGPPRLGSTPANAFGLYHMADGVHEWCLDWYAPYPQESATDPAGPLTGTRKVARGGSWRHRIPVTATRARSSLPPDHRYADFGFRLVIASR